MVYEDALVRIDGFGRFQKFYTFFLAFACVVPLMQNIVTIFSLGKHPFSCDYGDGIIVGYNLRNKYLLVCEREDLGEFANMFFFFGLALAGAFGGVIADKYGRRPLGLGSTSIMAAGGLLAPFMPSLLLHTVARTMVGLGIPGMFNSMFTILFETLSKEKRSLCYILTIQGWSSGVLFTALFGYLFPNTMHYEFAMGVLTLPLIFGCWILPESPRWLHYVMGRKQAARVALNKLAQWNGREEMSETEFIEIIEKGETTSVSEEHRMETMNKDSSGAKGGGSGENGEDSDIEKISIWEMLTYKYIMLATVITWYNWFAVSMCYYGWSLMVGDIGGDDKFINLLAGGAMEIGGRFGVLYLAPRVGRRPFTVFLLWMVSACAVAAAVLVEMGEMDSELLMVTGMLGRCFISWSWDILGLIMAEYAPTQMRVLISGTSSTACRIGGIVSSQFTLIGRLNPNGPHYLIIAITFTGGLSCLLYPETQGLELMDRMQEAEDFIRNNMIWSKKNKPGKQGELKLEDKGKAEEKI